VKHQKKRKFEGPDPYKERIKEETTPVRPLKLVQKCEAVTFLTAKTYLNYSWEGSEKIDKSNIVNSVVFKHLTIYEKTRSVPVGVDVESYDIVETKKKIQDLKFGAVLTINLHNKTKKKSVR